MERRTEPFRRARQAVEGRSDRLHFGGGGDYQARMRSIADLNQRSLLGPQRNDLTLRIAYEAGGLVDVEELVRQGTACCAFLTFESNSARRRST